MDFSPQTLALASALIFAVAALYSSVGHGGASGYLAVMALFAVPPEQMAGTALILNVVVAGIASYSFIRAGHLVPRLLVPFALLSVPLAFLGGALRIHDQLYYILLAFALLFAAFRLSISAVRRDERHEPTHPVPLALALPAGGGIGLLSGMVGVGGGIFLSPLMILLRWATAKETAAVSAVFILVNSLAGLAGRYARGALDVVPLLLPLAAAVAGGLLGSHIGARKFSPLLLRRVLAAVLVLASAKLVISAL